MTRQILCTFLLSALTITSGIGYASNDDSISWVLKPVGKAGRGIVEVMGDPNSGRWTTPVIDQHKHKAINLSKKYDPTDDVVETFVQYTGENCNEAGDLCLALYYFKSTRGAMDYSDYNRLVFEIQLIHPPSDALLLRIGSYPTRAELDIRDRLPNADAGWSTITVTKQEFRNYIFEGFEFNEVADPFSLTTSGTVAYKIRRIRWEK